MFHQWGWDRLFIMNGGWDILCTVNGAEIDWVQSMSAGIDCVASFGEG